MQPALGRVVTRKFGIDGSRVGPAKGHEATQQGPAQVRVHLEPLNRDRAREQSFDEVGMLAVSHRHQAAQVRELMITARLGRAHQAAQEVREARRIALTILRRGVERQSGIGLPQDLLHHPDLGAITQTTDDRVHERTGADLAVPGHVPHRTPQHRARQGTLHRAEPLGQRLQAARVQPDLGVGQIVVVEQQQVRPGPVG